MTAQRGKRTWKAKVALLGISCVVSFALAEMVVRVGKPGFPGFRLPQVEHTPSRETGYRMAPNQNAYTYAEPVNVNSLGLRGPEIRTGDEDTRVRIVCAGDSFTFGVGVSDKETYPYQLEQLLRKRRPNSQVEVINAGVKGYATYQEIDWLKTAGIQLKPDIVLLAVYSNDLVVRPSGDYSHVFEREREEAAKSFRRRLPRLYSLTRKSALLTTLSGAALAAVHSHSASDVLQGNLTEEVNSRWASMERELSHLADLGEQEGFRPLVVTLPPRIQIVRDFPNSSYPKRVHSACRELALDYVDVADALKASLSAGNKPYLPWDNHFSASGNRSVAEVIADHLQKEIIP